MYREFLLELIFFAELNIGWQNYTYLSFTEQDPRYFIFIFHSGLRFSFFPIIRINNLQYNNLPLGLIIMVAYNFSNNFGRHDCFDTYLGRDYDLNFIRLTLMLGYGGGAVDFDD